MSEFVHPDYLALTSAVGRLADSSSNNASEGAASGLRRLSALDCAWNKLRSALNHGSFPGYYKAHDGAINPVEPKYWGISDNNNSYMTGKITFPSYSGNWSALALMKKSDLDDFAAGRPAAGLMEHRSATGESSGTIEPSSSHPTRKGRKPNEDADKFWIEICVLLKDGLIEGGQVGLRDHMDQWAENHMKQPYDPDTVRKKISALWAALKWD